MADKIYAKGVFFKTFKASFGDILKMSINTKQFIEFLNANTNAKGYCNVDILERKEVGKFGDTHYATLNTYEKKEETESPF